MRDDAPKPIGRPFTPGVSGNPGGKPKGLERRVRDMLGGDIDAIMYVQRCVALGVPPDIAHLEAIGVVLTEAQREACAKTFSSISRRDANDAAKLLTDRGWGKAKQHVDVKDKSSGRMPKNMPTATDEQLRALAALDDGFGDEDDDEIDGDGDAATQH